MHSVMWLDNTYHVSEGLKKDAGAESNFCEYLSKIKTVSKQSRIDRH